jgi:hypothetical protein
MEPAHAEPWQREGELSTKLSTYAEDREEVDFDDARCPESHARADAVSKAADATP